MIHLLAFSCIEKDAGTRDVNPTGQFFVFLENCPVVMDKSFVFRKPTAYNLSGKLKAILITLFTPYLARSKRNVEVLL